MSWLNRVLVGSPSSAAQTPEVAFAFNIWGPRVAPNRVFRSTVEREVVSLACDGRRSSGVFWSYKRVDEFLVVFPLEYAAGLS